MKIEQIYTKCLAEAAYYIESQGEVAIIDPMREVEDYIAKAEEDKATIKYVFETHFHADFVSGHIDLAEKTGAPIIYGPTAVTGFDSISATDNQEFKVGELTIRVLHTPGHTPESVCYLLLDKSGKELAVFTGDTLFLGDVGRPDLAIKGDLSQDDLAGMLFDSLRNKIMTLPDDVVVYPAHGAGSSCGKNMSSETIGLLGDQKRTNYALRADMTREEFIKEVTDGILPPPQYFPKNAQMNKNGYESIEAVLEKGSKELSVAEVKKLQANGALVLDVRTQDAYIKGAIKNSLFIGLNGTFAMWVGALIEDINQEIILIAPEGQELEAVTRLARVGYDNCIGYLKGGMNSWVEANEPIETITSISAESIQNKTDHLTIVDVRKPGEYEAEHLESALFAPLDYLQENLSKLDKNTNYHIHCAGGYRSVIAISLLKQNGFTQLIDIAGGFAAIKKAGIPTTDFVCSSKKI
ncbi:MAG: MBL fold metallo-hydrolase [Fluviicola sp.]|jgi:glyoxylase-like metal-dependent hydrolase (beta-lactamase superfamily II)/rhodanese-related sulfurtransferase